MVKFFSLRENHDAIQKEVYESIHDTFEHLDFVNGRQVERFEKDFANYIGTGYCIGVSNGTDALQLAFEALKLPEGSEVIVPANTFIASALGVTHSRLKPIFADVEYNTMVLDANKLEKCITEKTKAILVVHLYGASPDMDKIKEIAFLNNLFIVEDCAQSHGSTFKGVKTGNFGDISCFSFYPSKNLGCYGDGGAVCTNNKALYDKMKIFKNVGSDKKYYHDIIGHNWRLDSVQAGILSAKLKYLDEKNQSRRHIAKLYNKKLSELDNDHFISLPGEKKHVDGVYHLYVIKVLGGKRDELKEYLHKHGVETMIHYPVVLYGQKAYAKYNSGCKTAEILASQILSLPMYPELKDAEVSKVCHTIEDFFRKK